MGHVPTTSTSRIGGFVRSTIRSTFWLGLSVLALASTAFVPTVSSQETPCSPDYEGNPCKGVEVCVGVGGTEVCKMTILSYWQAAY
jgi:hypothetical protein